MCSAHRLTLSNTTMIPSVDDRALVLRHITWMYEQGLHPENNGFNEDNAATS